MDIWDIRGGVNLPSLYYLFNFILKRPPAIAYWKHWLFVYDIDQLPRNYNLFAICLEIYRSSLFQINMKLSLQILTVMLCSPFASAAHFAVNSTKAVAKIDPEFISANLDFELINASPGTPRWKTFDYKYVSYPRYKVVEKIMYRCKFTLLIMSNIKCRLPSK